MNRHEVWQGEFRMARSALLLVNQKARSGRTGLEEIRAELVAGGLTLIDVSVDRAQDLSAVIRSHRDQVDLVIIGGGDGTLHHAMEGLLETQLPLGIIPLGTANDFARTLKLPADPLIACDVILHGRIDEIDLGQVNEKLFCNVASIGLAVKVTQRLKRESKSRWGVIAYLFAFLRSLWESRPFTVEITGDGVHFSARTVQVTIGNGAAYGGALIVHEAATAQDGLLHLFSLEIAQWWHIIPLIPALWKGKFQSAPQVRTLCGDNFYIRTPGRPRQLTADGEFVCSTPAQFRCLPRAVRVILPSREAL